MRRFITFFAVIALVKASVLYPLNELRSYDGSISRQEVRTPNGIRGTYTYIDGNGQTQTIQYGTDDRDAILKAPDSATVRSQAMDADSEVVESAVQSPDEGKDQSMEDKREDRQYTLPEPVTYTPEVAAARAEHFAARDQAIYLQQVASNQQQFLNQQVLANPFIREYYGAAKDFRTVNPYYGYYL